MAWQVRSVTRLFLNAPALVWNWLPILPIYSSFDFVVVLEFDDENSEHLDFVAPESDSAKNMYLDLSAAQSDEDNQDSEFVITESNDENNQDLPTAPKLDAEVDTENNDLDNAAPESNENKNFELKLVTYDDILNLLEKINSMYRMTYYSIH